MVGRVFQFGKGVARYKQMHHVAYFFQLRYSWVCSENSKHVSIFASKSFLFSCSAQGLVNCDKVKIWVLKLDRKSLLSKLSFRVYGSLVQQSGRVSKNSNQVEHFIKIAFETRLSYTHGYMKFELKISFFGVIQWKSFGFQESEIKPHNKKNYVRLANLNIAHLKLEK